MLHCRDPGPGFGPPLFDPGTSLPGGRHRVSLAQCGQRGRAGVGAGSAPRSDPERHLGAPFWHLLVSGRSATWEEWLLFWVCFSF